MDFKPFPVQMLPVATGLLIVMILAALAAAAAGVLFYAAVTAGQPASWSRPLELLQTAYGNLPKILYSAVLAVGAVLLLREIGSVWAAPSLGVGSFQVTADGKPDTARSEALRLMIVDRYEAINRELQREARERAAWRKGVPEDGTPLQDGGTEAVLALTRADLQEIGLELQGVNVGKILSGLRGAISKQPALTGQVFADKDGAMTAMVNWPGAPKARDLYFDDHRRMSFDGVPGDRRLAEEIACSLIWGQLLTAQNSGLEHTRRDQYCRWYGAFRTALTLRSLRGAGQTPGPEYQQEISRGIADLDRLLGEGASYPRIAVIKAELVSYRQNGDAAEQRTVSSEVARLAGPKPKGMAALTGGQNTPVDWSKFLQSMVEDFGEVPGTVPDKSSAGQGQDGTLPALDGVRKASGFIRLPTLGLTFAGGAVAIAPDRVVTAASVVGNTGEVARQSGTAPLVEFVQGSSAFGAGESHRVTKIDIDEASGLAMLTLETPLADVPGLVLSAGPEAGSAVTALPYVTALPSATVAVPEALAQQAGRQVALRALVSAEEQLPAGVFQLDAPALSSAAGAPVVDPETGALVGVQLGGDGAGQSRAVALPEAFLR